MKRLMLPMVILLLAFAAAAQDEAKELKTGKYTVTGKNINKVGEDIKIDPSEVTFIAWNPGPKDRCRAICPDESCSEGCILSITGFECALSKEGQCKGVSKTKIESTLNKEPEDYDFYEGTQLTYDMADNAFIARGGMIFLLNNMIVSSEDNLKITGSKVTGKRISIGDLSVSPKEGNTVGVEIHKGGIIAGKNARATMKGLEIEGRKGDFGVCIEQDQCDKTGPIYSVSSVTLDRPNKKFSASGKADGGPLVVFRQGNPFLESYASKTAEFEISNLEDSTITISSREHRGAIPFIELNVGSGRKSDDGDAPVILANGKTVLAAFKDDVWILNNRQNILSIKQEEQTDEQKEFIERMWEKELTDSMPALMDVSPHFKQDDRARLLMTAYNEIAMLPYGYSSAMINERLFDLPPTEISDTISYNSGSYPPSKIAEQLRPRLKNLRTVEGFSGADTKVMIDIFNRLPETVTSNIKGLKLVSDEEASMHECQELCVAWVDDNGKMFLKKEGITESTIYHELTHTYIKTAEQKNPESEKLRKQHETLVREYEDIEKKEPNSQKLEGIRQKADSIYEQRNKLLSKQPIVREWLEANELETMKKDMSGYCGDKITTTPGKGTTWSDGTTGPRYGVARPYGCTNFHEDIATFVENAYRMPSFMEEQAKCPPPNAYAKKIGLLVKYGIINSAQYSVMIPEGKRKCIAEAT